MENTTQNNSAAEKQAALREAAVRAVREYAADKMIDLKVHQHMTRGKLLAAAKAAATEGIQASERRYPIAAYVAECLELRNESCDVMLPVEAAIVLKAASDAGLFDETGTYISCGGVDVRNDGLLVYLKRDPEYLKSEAGNAHSRVASYNSVVESVAAL